MSLKKHVKVPRACKVVDIDVKSVYKERAEIIPDELWLSANPNICTYLMIADLNNKIEISVSPFVIVNFSSNEHLYLSIDQVVIFAEKVLH